ncbi:MAG TPA: hypothetical protein VD994_03150 [Prosthecobacter sp.]|nr:hypothetical protein [Prosthecobacter sp.]
MEIAQGCDQSTSLQSITREDLFAVTILGIGLYFVASSFGRTVNWIYYFATNHDQSFAFLIRTFPSFYDLSEPILTFAMGLCLTLSAKVWAKKLA